MQVMLLFILFFVKTHNKLCKTTKTPATANAIYTTKNPEVKTKINAKWS